MCAEDLLRGQSYDARGGVSVRPEKVQAWGEGERLIRSQRCSRWGANVTVQSKTCEWKSLGAKLCLRDTRGGGTPEKRKYIKIQSLIPSAEANFMLFFGPPCREGQGVKSPWLGTRDGQQVMVHEVGDISTATLYMYSTYTRTKDKI